MGDAYFLSLLFVPLMAQEYFTDTQTHCSKAVTLKAAVLASYDFQKSTKLLIADGYFRNLLGFI
jgi:hypothetical protein